MPSNRVAAFDCPGVLCAADTALHSAADGRSTKTVNSTIENRTHRPMWMGLSSWCLTNSYSVVRPIASNRAACTAETSSGRTRSSTAREWFDPMHNIGFDQRGWGTVARPKSPPHVLGTPLMCVKDRRVPADGSVW